MSVNFCLNSAYSCITNRDLRSVIRHINIHINIDVLDNSGCLG